MSEAEEIAAGLSEYQRGLLLLVAFGDARAVIVKLSDEAVLRERGLLLPVSTLQPTGLGRAVAAHLRKEKD